MLLYINFNSRTEHSYSGENDFPHTFNNRIYGPCTGKGGGGRKGVSGRGAGYRKQGEERGWGGGSASGIVLPGRICGRSWEDGQKFRIFKYGSFRLARGCGLYIPSPSLTPITLTPTLTPSQTLILQP